MTQPRRVWNARLVAVLAAVRDEAVLGRVGRRRADGYPAMMAVASTARELGWRAGDVLAACRRAVANR